LNRRCAEVSVTAGSCACCVRIDGAVCAAAPARGNDKAPANAANIAAILIRIVTPA
jgi:hypothetical protein